MTESKTGNIPVAASLARSLTARASFTAELFVFEVITHSKAIEIAGEYGAK